MLTLIASIPVVLGSFYIALNTPWIIDMLAKRYAPRWGFSYREIGGSPLRGIVVDDLRYRARPLARRVRIRLNPFALLHGQLRASDVELRQVNVPVLETMIDDFVRRAGTKGSDDQTNASFPLSVELDSVTLTLKPFARYGIRVYDEALHVDRIRYDADGIEVGALRQRAHTSMGTMELAGTYLHHILDVHRLRIEDLNLTQLQGALDRIRTQAPDEKPRRSRGATKPSDRFLPTRLRADTVDLSLLPVRIGSGIEVQTARIAGKGLDVDLAHGAIRSGRIEAHVRSGSGTGDMLGEVEQGILHIRSVQVRDLALSDWIDWVKHRRSEAQTNSPLRTQSGDRNGSIPFLPDRVDIKRATVQLRSGTLGAIAFEKARLDLEGAALEISDRIARRGRIHIEAETEMGRGECNATIRDNRLVLDPESSRLLFSDEAYRRYVPFLRPGGLDPIRIGGSIDPKAVDVKLFARGKAILARPLDANGSNLDLDRSQTEIRWRFGRRRLQIGASARIDTPWGKLWLHTDANRSVDGAWHYAGEIQADPSRRIPPFLATMLGRPKLRFTGEGKSIRAELFAKKLRGTFSSDDGEHAQLTLRDNGPISPARYFALPGKLSDAKVRFAVRVSLDRNLSSPIEGNVTLASNIADMRGTFRYDGNLTSGLSLSFPHDSLLKRQFPNLRLAALDRGKIRVQGNAKQWNLTVRSKELRAWGSYWPESSRLKAALTLGEERVGIEGKLRSVLTMRLHTPSIHRTLQGLSRLYRMQIPPMDGDLSATVRMDGQKHLQCTLRSKRILPDRNAPVKTPIEDLRLQTEWDGSKRILRIDRYGLRYAGLKLQAQKMGRIRFTNGRIVADALWITDSLPLKGSYTIEAKRGTFVLRSSHLKLSHRNGTVEGALDIRIGVDKGRIAVGGKVTLLGGKLLYDFRRKYYVSDDDIVIVQHRRKKSRSVLRKNLKISVYIETKKSLLFKQKGVEVKLLPQMEILKEFDSDLQIFGSIRIPKGGIYRFQRKRFVLQESAVNFTGNPIRPLLDLHLIYRRFGKTVYLTVSGAPAQPVLSFSSDPAMTREQILSFILFDQTEVSGNGENLLTLLGGSMAKSLLGSMGLQIDTLIVRSDGFELGKRLSEKISLYYRQREGNPQVIIRIRHSQHTQTEIDIGSRSQSVDIIYKKEF